MAKFRSAMTWAKKTKFKTLICLKANSRIRLEKKRKIALAFAERDRVIKQNSIWKIMRVAQYWNRKRLPFNVNESATFGDHLTLVSKKQALFKWIHFVSRQREQGVAYHRSIQLAAPTAPAAQQSKLMDNDSDNLLDWLSTFKKSSEVLAEKRQQQAEKERYMTQIQPQSAAGGVLTSEQV